MPRLPSHQDQVQADNKALHDEEDAYTSRPKSPLISNKVHHVDRTARNARKPSGSGKVTDGYN